MPNIYPKYVKMCIKNVPNISNMSPGYFNKCPKFINESVETVVICWNCCQRLKLVWSVGSLVVGAKSCSC